MSLLSQGIIDERLDPRLHDFKNLLWLVWRRLGLPEPTPAQYEIVDFIQTGPDPSRSPWEAPNNRLFIGGFRGVGKSWITSVIVDGYLAQDQSLNIMVVSGGQDRADDFTTFSQRVLNEIPEIAYLVPKRPERWSKKAWEVEGAPASHAPSVKSRSISGMLVGSRADIIIADDIETPENSDTQHKRELLEKRCAEFENIIKPGGRIIYLGTFQSQDSYYHLLPAKGYHARLWPARYPENIERYENKLSPGIVARTGTERAYMPGKPTDPKRFDEITLAEKEASIGKAAFALQFMLDPSMADTERYPLKLRDLVILDLHPKVAPEHVVWASGPQQLIEDLPNCGFRGDRYFRPMKTLGDYIAYSGSLLSIDPSGRGSNETTACVTKILNGNVYLLKFFASSDGYAPHTLETIARLAKEFEVNHVRYEDNFGDGMFGALLSPVLRRVYNTRQGGRGCAIDGIRHSKMKEGRILDALEPVMSTHRLIVDPAVIRWDMETPVTEKRLAFQMTRMQRLKGALVFDDRVDCLAIAMDYWKEIGALDVDFRDQMDARQEDLEWEDEEQYWGKKEPKWLDHIVK